jgi:hypothetical protein
MPLPLPLALSQPYPSSSLALPRVLLVQCSSFRRVSCFAQAAAFVAAPLRVARSTAATAIPEIPAVAFLRTTVGSPRFASSQFESRARSRRSAVRNDNVSTTTKKTDKTAAATKEKKTTTVSSPQDAKLLNLSTVTQEDLHTILVDGWGHPKFRVKQVWNWIREQGVTDVDQITNLPEKLHEQLLTIFRPGRTDTGRRASITGHREKAQTSYDSFDK